MVLMDRYQSVEEGDSYSVNGEDKIRFRDIFNWAGPLYSAQLLIGPLTLEEMVIHLFRPTNTVFGFFF